MRTATKIVMMSSSPALKFTTVGYSATWTPPTITAATLTDVQVKWIRPDGTSFTGKTPAMTNFSQLGNYQLRIKKWSRVTAFSFAPGGASRNWLSHINLDVMFPKMTGLLSCALRDMPSLVDIVTTWKLPSSMTSIAAFLQGCTGLTGVVTGWVLPTGVTNISYFLYGCTGLTGVVTGWILPTGATSISAFLYGCTGLTGVVTGWILPTGATSIEAFLQGCTGLTGVVTGWVLPTGATSIAAFLQGCTGLTGVVTGWVLPTGATNISGFLYGCTGLTGVVTGWILPTGVTNISYFLYGCTGLTGVFPTPAALSVCTSYQDIIKNNLLITGDVSTWTWRTNIINAAMSNTRLTYGTGQSLRTNVKNVLVFSMATCNLTQSMVDAVLVDLDTSAATGLVITLNGTGNAVPSAAGLAAKANILAKGGTVTVNT